MSDPATTAADLIPEGRGLRKLRDAMAGLSENMEALKHNFLFRGFFKSRGYFSLSQISPAEYRKGVITANGGVLLGTFITSESMGSY